MHAAGQVAGVFSSEAYLLILVELQASRLELILSVDALRVSIIQSKVYRQTIWRFPFFLSNLSLFFSPETGLLFAQREVAKVRAWCCARWVPS